MKRLGGRSLLLVLSVAWLGTVMGGFYFVTAYEVRESPTQAAPTKWPAGTRFERSGDRPAMLVFFHPKCPCSRATLSELAELLQDVPNVSATAVFVKPEGLPERWEHGPLWRQAQQIAGLKCVVDEAGNEAMRFHATISGQSLIYDQSGRLVYEGGLTGARGHFGRNAASDAARSVLTSAPAERLAFPTYGCPLLDPLEVEPVKACCKANRE